MLVVVLLAFVSPQYRALSRYYEENRQDFAAAETTPAPAPAVHDSPAESVADRNDSLDVEPGRHAVE